MKDTCYIILERSGVKKMTKTKPALKAGQYAIRLPVSIDDRFFDVAIPTANLTIGEEHLIRPDIEVGVDRSPYTESELRQEVLDYVDYMTDVFLMGSDENNENFDEDDANDAEISLMALAAIVGYDGEIWRLVDKLDPPAEIILTGEVLDNAIDFIKNG